MIYGRLAISDAHRRWTVLYVCVVDAAQALLLKYITALPDGHYQPVVITETCGGNAYIGKGDVGTVPAHKW